MQLDKSRARNARVLANRIQMCSRSFGKIFSLAKSDFPFSYLREESLFSRHKFPILFLFPYWVFFLSALLLLVCWRSFRSILSQLFFYFLRREKFVFSFILVLEKSLLVHYRYRMRGLTDFARPLRLGKKLLEIFDWLTATPFSLRFVLFALNRSFGFFGVWTSHLAFDFYRFSFSDSAAAIKNIHAYVRCYVLGLCAVGQSSRCFLRSCSVARFAIEGSDIKIMCRCKKHAEVKRKKPLTSKSIFLSCVSSSQSDFNVCFVSRTLTLTILNAREKLLCVSFFIFLLLFLFFLFFKARRKNELTETHVGKIWFCTGWIPCVTVSIR